MNLRIATTGLAVLFSWVSVTAYAGASGTDITSLLNASMGQWHGTGTYQYYGSSPAVTQNYTHDLTLSALPTGAWSVVTSTTTQDGNKRQNSATLSVRGDILYIQPANSVTATPTTVLQTTATSVTYKVQGVDATTGRPYTVTSHMELDKDGTQLAGYNVVDVNGVKMSSDEYTLDRQPGPQ